MNIVEIIWLDRFIQKIEQKHGVVPRKAESREKGELQFARLTPIRTHVSEKMAKGKERATHSI